MTDNATYHALARLQAAVGRVVGRFRADEPQIEITVNLKYVLPDGSVVRTTMQPLPYTPTLPGFGEGLERGETFPFTRMPYHDPLDDDGEVRR